MSKIGQGGRSISNYHGYGLYFISDPNRAKTYGPVVTQVTIDPSADILYKKVTPTQLKKIYRQLKLESMSWFKADEFFNNPKYGKFSVLSDVYEFYEFLMRIYRNHLKSFKDVSEFLSRAGISGMRVVNDVNDDILVIFNDAVINVIK